LPNDHAWFSRYPEHASPSSKDNAGGFIHRVFVSGGSKKPGTPVPRKDADLQLLSGTTVASVEKVSSFVDDDVSGTIPGDVGAE
jgi:hypothetical protein